MKKHFGDVGIDPVKKYDDNVVSKKMNKRIKINDVTRNTCMQQPLALIGIIGTIFSEHEVFRVYDFEIIFIFTLPIVFKKCENNESIISFNYKKHNLHKFFS